MARFKVTWLLGGVAALAIGLCLWLATIAFSTPKLQVGEQSYDAGIVPLSDNMQVVHAFWIKNIGRKTLRLLDIQSSCGCAVAKVEREISPGEKTPIRVTLKFSKNVWGKRSSSIRVVTNDPENPVVKFLIYGMVEPGCLLSPTQIHFGRVLAGRATNETFRLLISPQQFSGTFTTSLESTSPSELSSRLLSISQKRIATGYGSGAKEGADVMEALFEVKLKPSKKAGNRQEEITLKTNAKDYSTLKIPALWESVEPVHFEPNSLFFGIVKKGQAMNRTIQLVSERTDIEVSKAYFATKDGEPRIFDVQGVKQVDSKKVAIDLILNPSSVSGKSRSTLRVQTKDGKEYQTDVSVFVTG